MPPFRPSLNLTVGLVTVATGPGQLQPMMATVLVPPRWYSNATMPRASKAQTTEKEGYSPGRVIQIQCPLIGPQVEPAKADLPQWTPCLARLRSLMVANPQSSLARM
jgi:hypothetical protein